MLPDCKYCKNKNCFVLKYFTSEEVEIISKNKTVVFCEKGKPIFNEGEVTDSVYTLYEGYLDVMKKDYKGGDRRIYYVEPGELIGYCSAICGGEHTSTVTVYRNSLVCVIDKKVFLETFLRNSDFAMSLMKYLSEQICLREKRIKEFESTF